MVYISKNLLRPGPGTTEENIRRDRPEPRLFLRLRSSSYDCVDTTYSCSGGRSRSIYRTNFGPPRSGLKELVFDVEKGGIGES